MNGIIKPAARPTLADTLEALAFYAGQTKQGDRSTLTELLGILVKEPDGHGVTLKIFTVFIETAQGIKAPLPTAEVIPVSCINALRKRKSGETV